jgi:hypothetical protein
MSTIVTRAGKGSPLTNTEVDNNFTNLNTDKVEKSGDTLTGDLAFGDGIKAKFGASNDLEIYHDGNHSRIDDTGTGNLILRASSDIYLGNLSGEVYIRATENGAVQLRHDNSEKLATTSSGVDITGTVVADGLTVSKGSGDIATLEGTGTVDNVEANLVFNPVYDVNARIVSAREGWNLQSRLTFETGSDNTGSTTPRLNIGANGDISFYDDAGTSQDLYWDASTSRLGLGTTSPSGVIHATSSGVSTFVFQGADVGEGTLFQIRNATNNSATGNGHRLEFVHGNNNSRNVFFRTSSSGTFGRSPVLYIGSQNDTGGAELDHIEVQAGGDVAFYNDASTSKDFYWDASTSRLGLGTTSPDGLLHIDGTSDTVTGLVLEAGANTDCRSIDFHNATGDKRFGFSYDNTNIKLSVTDRNENKLLTIQEDGNVGIGTASPSTTLHVKHNGGGLRLQGESSDLYGAYLDFAKEAGTRRGLFGYTGSGTSMAIQNDESGDIRFNNNGSEAMRIDSSGRLLVGTTAYGYSGVDITVGSTSDSQNGIGIQTSTSGTGYVLFGDGTGADAYRGEIRYNHGSDFMSMSTAGSEAMRIDSSGRVGIGTTSLYAYNTRGDDLIIKNASHGGITIHSGTTYTGNILFADGTTGNEQYRGSVSYEHALDTLVFGTAGTEAARIDSSGNLLVGKTATSYSTEGVNLVAGGHVTRSGDTVFAFNRTSSDGSIVNFAKDGTTVGSISTSGGTTSYNTTSDYRLKENVTELHNASDRLNQLQVKQFNLIGHNQTVDGFLAHEVQDVVPQAVIGSKDEVDSNGNPVYQSIDHSKLVPLLTAALQGALSEIDSLKSRIAILEAN